MSENIEVEIRSFISKEKYEELIKFFNENSELAKEDFQETHYFDCEQDLRIQKNNLGAKIWLKKGKIHDDAREEIEIFTEEKSFDELGKLFNELGYRVEIKWLRERKQFNWNGIKACLDYTKGYGYIIELEKKTDKEHEKEILIELKEKLNQLNKENWRRLIE